MSNHSVPLSRGNGLFGNYVPERTAFYGSQYVAQSNNCEHAEPIMWARVLAKQCDLAKRCNLGESCFCAHRDIADLLYFYADFENKPPKEPVPPWD